MRRRWPPPPGPSTLRQRLARAARARHPGLVTLAPPFVLLDDAREGGAPARLYRDPVRVVEAYDPVHVRDVLADARASGLHAAGYLAYEAGAAFERRLAHLPMGYGPLLWLGLFDGYEEVDVPALLPDPAGAWVGELRPAIDRVDYQAKVARVQALIAAGDIYQANLTFQATVPLMGEPLGVYAALRARAGAGWGAVVATGREWILSLSPELFFTLDGRSLAARPMKGTALRGGTPAEDDAAAAELAADAKQRAENLMIVDLIRNDLARVAEPGSVEVPELFAVERYPTVLQMTSAVTATLAPGRDVADVLAAAFPCGSITGAPKLRAMDVLAEVEGGPRGIYTGSIGRIEPNGDARFNVAIRTLHLADGAERASMGLGSAIVADSSPAAEWDECLAKAAFLEGGRRRFDLIETMAFDPDQGIAHLERHLERMKRSADAFGFRFDRHGARNELQAATFRLRGPSRVRLLLAQLGAISIEAGPLPPAPLTPVEVAVMPLPVAPRDFRLAHKTTDRDFYDRARGEAGTWEVVFEDVEGRLTEGSFTNLFVARGDRLVTPPLQRGLLPGVLRAALLDSGRAVEGDLTREDLGQGFFVGNALRGLVPAFVAVANGPGRAL